MIITLNHNTILEVIQQRLEAAFNPTCLEIIDDSATHFGHSGNTSGGGHFLLKIRSNMFQGLRLIEQHRLIYAELQDLIPNKIHALSIDSGS